MVKIYHRFFLYINNFILFLKKTNMNINIFNSMDSIYQSYIFLNKNNTEDINYKVINFFKKNKEDLNITDKNITDFYKIINYKNNTYIRKLLSNIDMYYHDESRINLMYDELEKLFDYLKNLHSYKNVLYELELIKIGFLNTYYSFILDKYLMVKNSIKNNTFDLNIIKLHRDDDKYVKSFLTCEKNKYKINEV